MIVGVNTAIMPRVKDDVGISNANMPQVEQHNGPKVIRIRSVQISCMLQRLGIMEE